MNIVSEGGLRAQGIVAGYGTADVLQGVDLYLRRAEMVAIVGPNGAGKSTLLKVLTALITPRAGFVTLNDRPLTSFTRRELAREIAVVPQRLDIGFGMTAFDVVMLGRTPYLGFFGSPTARDIEAVYEAMEETDVHALAHRPFAMLSGGEQQRVILAMALAQETPFLLLDEPTVHLDLGQQWRFMDKLLLLRRQRNVGVLAVVHDLNLAGLFFERVLVLDRGRVVAAGPPATVLTVEHIARVFAAPVRVWPACTGTGVALDPGDRME
jgi:iron complex transport system ATP-binding protein